MPILLSFPPGFSDLDDSVLVAENPALALHVSDIYNNGVFGMARTELFVTGPHLNGDTVPLPVSRIDGYVYSREECIYAWSVHNTVDESTGWITGRDSLWYCNWLVEQENGQVHIDEYYRRSGAHFDGTHTNDGSLIVWTIAQRQKTHLIVSDSPVYTAISGGDIGVDQPLKQRLAQGLNEDSKFCVLNTEIFYLGEYGDSQTVLQPTSPADGYVYDFSECQFMFSWRWTAPNWPTTTTKLTAPSLALGQLGPILASIDPSTGLVSIDVYYIDNSGSLVLGTFPTVSNHHGRIAVYAFCKRNATPSSITPAATNFAEVGFDQFMPGATLRASTVQQMIDNMTEALLTPEYFGPTTYGDGIIIPKPVSTVDGYEYSRDELIYVWAFNDTTNATGSNLRMATFGGNVNQSTGQINLYGYRLPPGGPYVDTDGDTPATISVIVVARRSAHAPTLVLPSETIPQDAIDSTGAESGADTPTLATGTPETPAGSINSSNTSFTTSTAYTFIELWWNGQERSDFTYSGTTITTSFTPDTGDDLYIVGFK